ncbi:hypothetical protein IZ6_06460 [Terrihabitans soli]|uniref:Uncharacterized protein n=1 Tax=Terrihabitans soli TaxID=708113 RepID=A0A6S6QS88_9HYPH|nr:hypothetical protein IZ6_06460 [Terrihabitans soli]
MVCGVRETVTVTSWGVCWAWVVPYPCRKTSQKTRYHYDFRPWRTRFSWSPFRYKYQGCCGGLLYEWSFWRWSPFGTGNGPWVDTEWKYYSDSTIGSIGNCPFGDGGVIQ